MTGHVIDSLSEFLDDALAAPARRAVEEHLSACASCRGELEDLRAASNLLKDLPLAELPVGFMQRLERRRNEGSDPSRGAAWGQTPFLPMPARMAAFAMSSVIVGLVVYDKFQGPGARLDSMVSGASSTIGAFSDMPVAPAAAPAPALEMKSESAFDSLAGKAERRVAARGLAKARGRSLLEEGSGLSGASAAAVRGFAASGSGGGAPVGEAMPQAPRFSNESLQKDLERQKSAMGIRQILPLDDSKQKAAEEDEAMLSAGFTPPKLNTAPQPRLKGLTPRMEAPGSAAAAKTSGILGVVAPFGGTVVRRPAELPAAWAQAGLEISPPAVNFARHALVIAPGGITEVRETNGRVVVHYREGGPQAGRYALIEATKLSVVFESDR